MVKDMIIAFLLARILITWDFFIIPTPADGSILFGILMVLSFITIAAAEERAGKIWKIIFGKGHRR